jgi:hypothetical protein
MINKKINVVPCTVKILLNVIASVMICAPGKNNSALIARAKAPPINKNATDVMRYSNPTSV